MYTYDTYSNKQHKFLPSIHFKIEMFVNQIELNTFLTLILQ